MLQASPLSVTVLGRQKSVTVSECHSIRWFSVLWDPFLDPKIVTVARVSLKRCHCKRGGLYHPWQMCGWAETETGHLHNYLSTYPSPSWPTVHSCIHQSPLTRSIDRWILLSLPSLQLLPFPHSHPLPHPPSSSPNDILRPIVDLSFHLPRYSTSPRLKGVF